MSRLIDADELFNWGDKKLKDAVKYGNKSGEQHDWSFSTLMMYEIADEVNDAPTVDAVPVVRCRDCEHWDDTWCDINEDYFEDDDFCSYGERKENRG